ncbi:MAG: hypothetical protein K6B39_03040 [Lachnospiraceae bacterium]|jgi:hypothetical protein|nr:hypothetical protein [Lachnospiraceae bacterium]MCR5086352.1 hypothetical protein [Lachnospiraceae bacterium]
MRLIDFKMERPGLLKAGDEVHITEGTLPSSYYYTIDPSLAMSANLLFRERIKSKNGVVRSIEETPRGFYVKVEFDEDEPI